jgi:hypothetical protein
MIVCYDQPLPVQYQAYTSSSATTWALAMILTRQEFSDYQLSLRRMAIEAQFSPHTGFDWLKAMLNNQREGFVTLKNATWYWSLKDANAH